MRISVIGTGYLGATHAAWLAELGFEVLGVHSDDEKVARLARVRCRSPNPVSSRWWRRQVRSGRLRFSTDLREAAMFADVHFICVGTPQSHIGLAADVSAVLATARALLATPGGAA